ncbi:hypothetical protein [Saccharomonospora sp. NB11]|jgi:hypothetical protein|uniref:hypothetical protein n=1 Tax=Saccharomonospora sp. NB11 TaxID=1642298 RepID=UPI0018D0E65D|nr:hypothetical protein [Saccharomonospora sp. NB11]
MRSVRRGLVASALALPLAFGFAGVATAGESNGEGSVDWAGYEASFAVAGPWGAAAGDIASEAFHASYSDNGDDDHKKGKHGDSRHDARGGEDKHKDKNGDSGEVDWAAFEASGAAAGPLGAAAGSVGAASFHAEQD